MPDLRGLLALAYIEGLQQKCPLPPVRVVTSPAQRVVLDDTGRAPNVPLRPAQRRDDVAPAQSGDVLDGLWFRG